MFVAAVAVCLQIRTVPAQEAADELQGILDRAAGYVALYEDEQLGNVLASETYVQNTAPFWEQRRTESDFLIVLVGDDRMGIRKVNRVDGAAVKSAEESFEAMMDDSPKGILKRIAALKEESSRYNIGPVLRNINLPTFALKVLRRGEAPRFAFTKRGADKVNGIETVEVRFQEQRAPTLVQGKGGESLLSSGAVWIEPATGRVLKTEFFVENPYTQPKVKGRVTVTYSISKALGILVPDEMKERYETDDDVVDCTAKYSNFRSFNVEVKSVIEDPAKQ